MKLTTDSRLVLRVRKHMVKWVVLTHALLLTNIPMALSDIPDSQKLGYALVTGSSILFGIAGGLALWLVAVKLKA